MGARRALSGLFDTAAKQSPGIKLVLSALNSVRPQGLDARAVRPPHICSGTSHYDYAIQVLAGVPNAEACEAAGVSPKTAERYRAELRAVAAAFFGREVTYEYAVRYALDEEWRRMVDGVFASAEPAAVLPSRFAVAAAKAPGAAPAPARSHVPA